MKKKRMPRKLKKKIELTRSIWRKVELQQMRREERCNHEFKAESYPFTGLLSCNNCSKIVKESERNEANG